MTDGEYVSVAVAADLANIPARTIRYWVQRKKVATVAGKRGKLVNMRDVDRVARDVHRGGGNVLPALPADESTPALATDVATTTPLYALYMQLLVTRDDELRRLDERYRAEIAAKDALIAELRRRAEQAEQTPSGRPRAARRRFLRWLLGADRTSFSFPQ